MRPVAVTDGTRKWSELDLRCAISAWGVYLGRCGVRAGDRVALLSANAMEWVPLWFALRRLGAALVPLNTRLTPHELSVQLDLVKPSLVLADHRYLPLVPGAQACPRLNPEGREPAPPSREASEGVAAILFTSGTTGTPKAVQLTWRNFLSSARASRRHLREQWPPIWLLCLPLFHVGGLAMVVRAVESKGTLAIHDGFEAARVSRALDEGVTHLSLVAATLRRLLEHRGRRPFPSSVRTVLVGGGPVPEDLLRRARALKLPVLQTYGLTEACSQVTTELPHQADGATAGVSLPGTEVRVVDPLRCPVEPGRVGEIEVRGPTVMIGYLHEPNGAEPAVVDGWLRTKDLGSLDAGGRLTVHARRSDLIVSGGENIYPAEIESILAEHPRVLECAVVALEDLEWGQRPGALVVSRGKVGAAQLQRWCGQRLARFKVPRVVVTGEPLPRNAGGKIDRMAVLARVAG